jgi:hypothetical protein
MVSSVLPIEGGRVFMYQRPQLQVFGSLRELTQAGWNGSNDGFAIRIVADGDQLCPWLENHAPGCS